MKQLKVHEDQARYIEGVALAFAMYCDERDLGVVSGRDLAERIGDELRAVADDREWQEGVKP